MIPPISGKNVPFTEIAQPENYLIRRSGYWFALHSFIHASLIAHGFRQLYKSVPFLTKLRPPGRLRFYFDTTIKRTNIISENVDEYCSF